ncbi:unnamed protein product [Miscanthus lutarioriparius]|uniref:Uncharacterized protein n=1 Tax=Miscanthus lutarioriparius TaxID=422564 RepID=A0A811QLD8_9POAL|nr:unnamed protein product [Miscanthus lutarioriparius]
MALLKMSSKSTLVVFTVTWLLMALLATAVSSAGNQEAENREVCAKVKGTCTQKYIILTMRHSEGGAQRPTRSYSVPTRAQMENAENRK